MMDIHALPSITDGNCLRWIGVEPAPLLFAVEPIIPIGMVTLLASDGGAGKTLLQQLICTCIASGQNCIGFNTESGCAAGVFAEDPANILHIRQNKLNRALGIEMDTLKDKLYIQSYAGHNAVLWHDNDVTPFYDDLEKQLAVIPDLKILVLDNAALLFSGNENDRGEVTAFLNALNGLADRLGIAVLLSTHTSKSNDGSASRMASGSTAWINASRSALELKPATESDGPVLRLRKANHTKAGDEYRLEWTDGILERAAQDSFTTEKQKQNELDRLIFEAVKKGMDSGTLYSAAPQCPDRYLAGYIERITTKKFKKRDVEKAMLSWIDHGFLVTSQKNSRAAKGLTIVKQPPISGFTI